MAAEDFVQSILARAPASSDPDVLVTVILDGENAWEWYRLRQRRKQFLNALYRKLSRLYQERRIVTVTTTEYIEGNQARGVPAHPPESLPAMEWLWPGSWINGNYDTWIGEAEENRGWEYLLRARTDLENRAFPGPAPVQPCRRRGRRHSMRIRPGKRCMRRRDPTGSGGTGSIRQAPGGDEPFDAAFRTHLRMCIDFASKAAGAHPCPSPFEPIIKVPLQGGAGEPGRGHGEVSGMNRRSC